MVLNGFIFKELAEEFEGQILMPWRRESNN